MRFYIFIPFILLISFLSRIMAGVAMDRQAMKYPTSRSLWTQYSSKMLKKGALLSSLDLHEVCIKLSVPITTFYIIIF